MNNGKNILLTLGSLAFVAIGIFLLIEGDPSDRLMALGVTLFFGACALVGLLQLLPAQRAAFDAAGGLTIQPDRIQLAGMAIAAIGMAAGCYIFAPIAAYENKQIISLVGYAGAIFFGLGGLFILWRVFTDKPLARIDQDGVRTFGVGAWSLAWRDIGGVQSGAIAGQPFLAFDTNAARVLPTVGSRYTLGVHGSRLSFEDLQGAVFELWQRHRDASAPAALQH